MFCRTPLFRSLSPPQHLPPQATEVNISVPGVKSTDKIQVQIDAAMTTGVGIGNAYTNADNQITVRLMNLTGASVTQAAATMLVSVKSCEDSPIPSNVV
jgi:hypothetical protein